MNDARQAPELEFPGWRLIGAYPDGDPGDVGSWLLHHAGEALLLEVPEGLTVRDVKNAVRSLKVELRFITASHEHYDHLDPEVWAALTKCFPEAEFVQPASVRGDRLIHIGDEPLWLVQAPKHSSVDVVTVFRGVAMTGDIELGTIDSVTDEVSSATRMRSMQRLRDFPGRTGYRVHTIVSAHLNDLRRDVDWRGLFDVGR
jgi:hypothetical protein